MPATLALTAWTIASAAITGLLLALLGSLKLAMARRPERVTAPVSLLLALLNVALLPLLLLSGLLTDFWGLRPMMVAGPVLLALALLTLSAGPSYRRTQFAVVLAALAAASLATTGVALMPRALFGEGELVASLQLGMVFVALGALVSAPLVDLMLRGIGFRRSMAVLALVCLLPAFLVFFLANAEGDRLTRSFPLPGGLRQLIESPGVWLGALVFFFYAPLEGFASVWTTKYLQYLGEHPGRATRLLIVFWSAVILSRLLLGTLQHAAGWRDSLSPWFIIVPALMVAVVLGNLSAMTKIGSIGPGLFMLGLCMGPIYPLVVGLVFKRLDASGPDDLAYHPAYPGTAYALLCAGGSVGGLLLSPLLGFCARSRSLPVALLIPTFVALILTAAAVLFALQPTT